MIPDVHYSKWLWNGLVYRLGLTTASYGCPAPLRIWMEVSKSRPHILRKPFSSAVSTERVGRNEKPPLIDRSAGVDIKVYTSSATPRSVLAASTMASSAALVSGQARVFSPQSGLTHNCSAGITALAFSSKVTISSLLGTRGEWISYTPGPMSFG